MFSNPLREVDEDQFVLHFYDLSAQQPHTFYRFVANKQVEQVDALLLPGEKAV